MTPTGETRIRNWKRVFDLIAPARRLLHRHREFVGNVATMVSGRSAAAIIGLLATPIISRLFEPGDFGVAAAFLAIASIISDVGSLRYGAAVVLPKDDGEALAIRALAFRILWLTSLGVLLFITITRAAGIEIQALSMLGVWAWLLPLAVLLTTAVHIQESWLTRAKSFKTISASQVVATTVNSGSRIGAGAMFGSSALSLIVGDILGTLARFVQQRLDPHYTSSAEKIHWRVLVKTAREYQDFPRLNAPAGFVMSLGGHLPVLLFGAMFSPVAAGLYAMALRLSRRPIAVLSTAIRRVFLQKAASIRNRGESLKKAFLLSTGGLVLLGIAPLLILWFFGQPLLGWILGDQWIEAGRYLEIIAPWMFMIWVTAPANPIFVVLRRQKLWLVMTTLLTLLRLSVFGVALLIDADLDWTLVAYVIATVLSNLLTIAVALWIISEQDRTRET